MVLYPPFPQSNAAVAVGNATACLIRFIDKQMIALIIILKCFFKSFIKTLLYFRDSAMILPFTGFYIFFELIPVIKVYVLYIRIDRSL
jgi:hypothetical protein